MTCSRPPRRRPTEIVMLVARSPLCALLLALLTPAAAGAQRWFEVAAGVVVPKGAYRETRTSGPLVRAAVSCRQRHKRVTVRGELEGAAMFGGRVVPGASSSSETGSAFAVSALASYVVALVDSREGPYGFVGLGVGALAVPGEEELVNVAPAGRAGFGARMELRGIVLHAETAVHLTLSGHGHAWEFNPVVYRPVVFGVSF